jgi:chromosome segregation protein
MRLQRLEINGFKSFSDRSELAFDKGVTAIVGPNGCGKSNVADAITWVMGEQSAKSLRGDRMEDVIFSGSDARKPTATAEVRLRFSGVAKSVTGPPFRESGAHPGEHVAGSHANGNGHGPGHSNGNGHGHTVDLRGLAPELASLAATGTSVAEAQLSPEELIQSVARDVEVTRRLYRSGESEYLIDGQICRLKDVHELLMDTGLGAKAYAIIEQGKIGMILSTRPTDRRQLIEEAAGVTRYRARRRTAELKLEAAQLNLTRIDDIVFEVEKQRGTLKRQAAKARRYQKLRDELRRWEKVLLARKYRLLAETIQSVRGQLTEAREHESGAAGRLAALESDFSRVRLELVQAESEATIRREAAHACELGINRQQQQLAFDKSQIEMLRARATSVAAELDLLNARRAPARDLLSARRLAAEGANAERERAAEALAFESGAYSTAHREIEGLEADVEAARSEVFSSINSATALRHSLEHAAIARDRVGETMAKLAVEAEDVRVESERVSADEAAAADGLRRAQAATEAGRIARAARESELASARIEHEWRARSIRAREQELAGLEARLKSLQELEAARAEYGDAARTVLAQADGSVGQRGAIADYLDVESGSERAVEACLGDLLQHVVVETADQAAAGLQLVREHGAGRCGFLIAAGEAAGGLGHDPGVGDTAAEGLVALSAVVRVQGPYAGAIRQAMGHGWIADSYDRAAVASRSTAWPVATAAGDVFRGPQQVTGGNPDEARGILETKRAIKDLIEPIAAGREALFRLAEETAGLEGTIAHASSAMAALNAELHKLEKVIVGLDAQLQRAAAERARLVQRSEQLALECGQAQVERDSLEARQVEARASIARLEADQRAADERLTTAQRRLFEAREATEELGRRAADAGAVHARLVERGSALAAEVQRLEEALVELEARAVALAAEGDAARERVETLRVAIVEGEAAFDREVRTLDLLKGEVQAADDVVSTLRVRTEAQETDIKAARTAVDTLRAAVAELDIRRVTAESDLAHLAQASLDTVQAPLDDVLAEVTALEATGDTRPDPRVICVDEPPSSDEDEESLVDGAFPGDASTEDLRSRTDTGAAALTAEDAIARLRARIDRLGPVNMMAIEQFDELESRHSFLTVQRKDLVDSIAQTAQAIKQIDETTRSRFAEAFAAINRNFQETFSTLFGGGRAGLTLLDEADPLESGIEIIAQPPGKRLQSVQLLSGGEKALTAIALMFGLFKYKPSPFCLLDEIDAPLDDANIGRFVEMLRGMLGHTQFILITHNRKTMEIADRLYGVTMEEPGVSKLISVQFN